MRYPNLLLLACLALSPATFAQTPAPGQQVEQSLSLSGGGAVPYLLYLPKEYDAGEKRWPLMLFLHGRGESHGPLSLVKQWGPPKRIDLGEQFPFIVASPQCPSASSWSKADQQAALIQLLDHLKQTLKIDTDRVHLTGLSMGGYGSWRLAADHPEWFASVAPICGAGNPADGPILAGLPIWVWHGTDDGAVPYQKSVDMVEAIRAAGGEKVRFTTLQHIGHVSWEAAYTAPDLYAWMAKQTASGNQAGR